MNRVIRTIYNSSLQAANLLGTPYQAAEKTTLNEKYAIGIDIIDTVLPSLAYYGAGINFKKAIDTGVIDLTKASHSATDADVYYPLPFLLKAATVGLTDNEELLYRIKTSVTVDGVEYIACYLKKFDGLDTSDSLYGMTYNSTLKDYVTSTLDTTAIDFLSPVPAERDCNDADLSYVGVSQKVYIKLSAVEIDNMRTAADILYPNIAISERHSIGEVALYSGIESVYKGKPEAAKVQANFFKPVNAVIASGDTFALTINVGGMLPMI